MNLLRLLLARGWVLACLATLTACSFIDDPMAQAMRRVTPYRTEVVQGNFVSKEQVQALRPGMNRNQVKDILGTPLIASVFHADRWDYAFTIQRKGTAPQQRKLSVFFKNDLYDRVEAQDLPSEAEFAARISEAQEHKSVPRLQATPQELDKFNKNTPSKPPVAEAPVKPAPKSYPPLEPSAN